MKFKLARRVESLEQLQRHMDSIVAHNVTFGFDIETGYWDEPRENAAVHPEEAIVVGVSYAVNEEEGWYVPIQHDLFADNLPIEQVAEIMKTALTSELAVIHNMGFEWRELNQELPRGFGYDIRAKSDTMFECFVLQRWKSVALKGLSESEFGYTQITFAELFPELKGKKLKQARFNDLDVTPQVLQYACDDAVLCLALHNRFYEEVKDDPIYRLEMQLIPGVVEMEDFGVWYDWDYMAAGAARAKDFIVLLREEIMAELSALAGTQIDINLASPKQVGDVLYGTLAMPVSIRSDKTQAPSTSATAMEGLAQNYPVVRSILHWKGSHGPLRRGEPALSADAEEIPL